MLRYENFLLFNKWDWNFGQFRLISLQGNYDIVPGYRGGRYYDFIEIVLKMKSLRRPHPSHTLRWALRMRNLGTGSLCDVSKKRNS